MENNKKTSMRNRILIICIILFSVLSIAYKVLAGALPMLGTSEIRNGPPEWENMGFEDGIIKYEGGSSEKAPEQLDDGVLDFYSGAGAGGNGGAVSWNWNGIEKFECHIASGNCGFYPNGKGEIWYQDLQNNVGVLCQGQGKGITGLNNFIYDYKATGKYWEHEAPDIEPLLAEVGLKNPTYTYSLKEADEKIQAVRDLDKAVESYEKYFRTSCKYGGEDRSCTPAEAIVLSEVDNCTIGGANEYTPIQYAWWAVTNSGLGGNELSKEAFEFQNYVNSNLGGKATTHTTEKGTFTGFPIKYDPQFKKTSKDYTVSFNAEKQQYIIGPFKIDYIDSDPFSFIKNIEIYADDSNTPIDKKEYTLVDSDLKKITVSNTRMKKNYPSSGQEFYIVLNYNENFKTISDIEVEFQYMNAGGSYTHYTGEYTKVAIKGHIYGKFDYDLYLDIKEFSQWVSSKMSAQMVVTYGTSAWDIANSANRFTEGSEEEKLDFIERALNNKTDIREGEVAKAFCKYFLPEGTSAYVKDILASNGLLNTAENGGKYVFASDEYIKYFRGGSEANYFEGTVLEKLGENKAYLDAKINEWKNELEELKKDEDNNADRIKTLEECIDEYEPYSIQLGVIRSGAESLVKYKDSKLIPGKLTIDIWKDYEFINQGNVEAQPQAVARGAARWWEYKTIHWSDLPSAESAKIKIVKKFDVDNQAKEGDTFNFTLKVNNNGETKTEPLTITYKEGQTEYFVESDTYTWEKGQNEPTYLVVEDTNSLPDGYDKNGVTITNGSGKLTNGKTTEVIVTNKLEPRHGTLKIVKKFEDTKLDDNQFLRQQTYEFEVTISGKCKFTYEGTEYNLGDNESKTIIARIDLSKGDTWELNNFIWYRDSEPKYEVKEKNNSPIEDVNRCEYYYTATIENSKGNLRNNETVQVDVKNIQKTESSSIKIIKEFEGQDKFSEEDLQDMTFKFLVNVYSDEACNNVLKDTAGNEYKQKEVIVSRTRATKEDADGKTILDVTGNPVYYWRWEGKTDEYVWLSGNYPWYTVKEDETWCPKHKDKCTDDNCSYKKAIKFDESKTQGVQTDGSIKGRFSKNDVNKTVEIPLKQRTDTALPINILDKDKSTEGKVVINKEVSQELYDLLNQEQIDIVVKVSGTFGFDENNDNNIDENEWHNNETIQLSNVILSDGKKYKKLENKDEYDSTTFITFTKSDFQNLIATWESSKFQWYGEAPQIEILEDLNGKSVTTPEGIVKEIHSSGIPNGWKSLDEAIVENDIYKYEATIKNDISEDEAGYIKIIKKLEKPENLGDSKLYTIDYINSLRFKFEISVAGYSPETVILGDEAHPVTYDAEKDEYRWEYISGKYSWEEGSNAPTYEVRENTDGLAPNVRFVRAEGENVDNEKATVSGTLKNAGGEIDTAEFEPAQCTFINKVDENNPDKKTIHIEKEFTDDNLINDTNLYIEYKVTISGVFKYEGENYNGDHTFTVKLDCGKKQANKWVWNSGEITYYGEEPTYTVEELENTVTKLVSSQNTTGKVGETATFVNEPQERSGYLSISKAITVNDNKEENKDKNQPEMDLDQEFTFKVTIKDKVQNIKIKAGKTWTSDLITWKAGENAPQYTVEEVDIPSGYELQEIQNATGYLTSEGEKTVEVTAINKMQPKKAQFKVAKKVIFNKLIDSAKNEKFTINIQVKGTFKILEGSEWKVVNNGTYEIKLDQESGGLRKLGDNDAYVSPTITWWGNNAPTVIVKEVQKEGWSTPLYSNNGDTGMKLQAGSDSNNLHSLNTVVITNRIQIEMELMMKLAGVVWNDVPLDPESKNTEDSVENGRYDAGSEQGIKGVQVKVYRVINDKSGREVLREDAISYTDAFEAITQLPILTSEDGSWEMTGLRVPAFSEAEKSKYFTAQQIANRDFSNYSVKYDVEFIYDGQTYEPTELLEFYDDVTDSDKKATREEDYLSKPTRKGINKNNENKQECMYFYDSLALDYDRDVTNSKIANIYGKNPISGDGTTIGAVSGSEGEKTVMYEAQVPSNTVRVKSELQTRDSESNLAYELYRTAARTSEAGLEFPVSKTYQLEYKGTQYNLNGTTQYYRALYEESLHINLGLKNRKTVDIDASKDLHSAKVVVDGKEINYTFNSLADILNKANMTAIDKTSNTDKEGYTYELGLYRTDYYYRAEIYKSNAEVYDSIQSYYKKLTNGSLTAKDSELEVFLTYRINLYNTSETNDYKVKINELDDYFDSSFGEPIQTQVKRVVNDEYKEVANASYLTKQKNNSTEEETIGNVTWTVTERNIKGSDGGTYNKMTANFSNLDTTLSSGENRYIYVTFAVKKDTVNEVEDCIALGNKSNIVEIANYTTYYSEGVSYHTHGGTVTSDGKLIAGKIDKDSAPRNINIVNHNDEKKWYEDDTDAAPILNITLMEDNRKVDGIAWEDKDDITDSTKKAGKGYRDDDEALIGGLTTELIEKITLPEIDEQGKATTNKNEYDFLWPTNESLDVLGGKTLKYLTGFDSTTETSRKIVNGKDKDGKEIISMPVGGYEFTGIPTGTYAVRFLYGNNKLDLEDTDGVSPIPAEALDDKGEIFGGRKTNQGNEQVNADGKQILTANYDGDWIGSTAAVYNGQDYKSTIYQSGFEEIKTKNEKGEDVLIHQTDDNGYFINREHCLLSEELKDTKVSDARDSEYRRLEVIAESETITNVNSSILDTATELSADHNDLYEDYNMFADTANINLNIESTSDVSQLNGVVVEEKDNKIVKPAIQINISEHEFKVPSIDFGLIERPETKVVLDKEIKEIKLTTNDKKDIFDAIYNISYETMDKTDSEVKDRVVIGEISEDQYLVAKVELDTQNSKGIDVLQAISKNEKKPEDNNNSGTQNFRFINVDSEILQGTTIELTYLISALNVGEEDYTSVEIDNITNTRVSENGDPSIDIKAKILEKAGDAKKDNSTCKSLFGQYLGTNYYTGNRNEKGDALVASKVRQIIDYVDNDGVFTPEYNTENDHIWRNTSITELTGNGYEVNRLISKDTIPEYEILDKNYISYITGQRNNLILSTDDQSEQTDDVKSNENFERKLVPYTTITKGDTESDEEFEIRRNNAYSSQITLTVTKTVSAQDDADNLTYDNLTEIVKFENSVGRRDVTTIAGNANPKLGEFKTALEERDTSATELVTFTPPTGIEVEESMTTQILVIVMLSLGVVVLGIVVIKKKVLK